WKLIDLLVRKDFRQANLGTGGVLYCAWMPAQYRNFGATMHLVIGHSVFDIGYSSLKLIAIG
ncbi:MAG: hypothetical protein WCP55_10165, partial [Lentisphaerota bacterium]